METRAWRLYYADGSRFSSELGSIEDAPEGPQVVVEYHDPPYKTFTYGEDQYTVAGRTFESGPALPDDEWEALRQRIHREA